jgi:hypothetical protein
VNALDAIFRALQFACPAEFRRECGAAMRRDFAQGFHAELRSHGAGAALTFAFGAYADLLVTGPREIRATMFRDFAFALRTLRKTPVFAAIVVLTLALASGANATVFSILRAVVLAPLPYPESGRLVAVLGTKDAGPFSPSLPDFRDVSTRSTSFAALSAFASRNRNREIGFVFQNFNLIGDLTVAENATGRPATWTRPTANSSWTCSPNYMAAARRS